MRKIEWYTIPKFPVYEINTSLEVRHKRIKKIKSMFMSEGYWRLNIDWQGKKYKPGLHQLVAWAFIPNPENKPEIHHIDGDSLNNCPLNLKWVTKTEHRKLSILLGQVPHKIKPEEVIEIRNNYSVEKEQALALKYGVHPNTIYLIAIGKTRQHVVGGERHPLKTSGPKKIININTKEEFGSSSELALLLGIKEKEIRRKLNGERYNNTPYRYLGQEHLSRMKPNKVKIIPFVPHAFGVVISRKEYTRSRNPHAQWKRVAQCDLDGREIATHTSIRNAARAIGAKDHKPLQKLLNGRKGKTYKKFMWKFIE